MLAPFHHVLQALGAACRETYGERLKCLAIFGSVARGTPRPDSDIDLLLVASDLPRGRTARMEEFQAVERAMSAALEAASREGVATSLSPVFRTPAELEQGGVLLLDMTEEVLLLLDDEKLLERRLDALRARLAELGARRVPCAGGHYWVLTPEWRPGDSVEI